MSFYSFFFIFFLSVFQFLILHPIFLFISLTHSLLLFLLAFSLILLLLSFHCVSVPSRSLSRSFSLAQVFLSSFLPYFLFSPSICFSFRLLAQISLSLFFFLSSFVCFFLVCFSFLLFSFYYLYGLVFICLRLSSSPHTFALSLSLLMLYSTFSVSNFSPSLELIS